MDCSACTDIYRPFRMAFAIISTTSMIIDALFAYACWGEIIAKETGCNQ